MTLKARRNEATAEVARAFSHLRRPFDLVRPNQQVSRNFPCLADLVNHLDRQRTAARENFGSAGARAQKLGKLGPGVASSAIA